MKADLELEQRPAGAPIPVATHEIRGGGGVRLHAREWGRSDRPALLLIHGWSQSDLCWTKQLSGELTRDFHIVTFDLRGHGLFRNGRRRRTPTPIPSSGPRTSRQ